MLVLPSCEAIQTAFSIVVRRVSTWNEQSWGEEDAALGLRGPCAVFPLRSQPVSTAGLWSPRDGSGAVLGALGFPVEPQLPQLCVSAA